MYSMGPYFLEIVPESIPGYGWTGQARFSRRSDYRKHLDDVRKVTFPTHIVKATRTSAESAIVTWARDLVASSADVLEASLRIAAERPAGQE